MSVSQGHDLKNFAVKGAIAHPGFTGAQYDFGGTGTLIIGMNRGGSSVSTVDSMEQRCLLSLEDKADSSAYAALSQRCFQLLPNWNLWSRNLHPLLTRSGVTIESVAYIHGVPFRVNDNEDLNHIYELVWDRLTHKVVEFLNPRRVLFAGNQVGKTLAGRMDRPFRIVPRTGRDIARPNHDGVPHARNVARSHDQISTDQEFWN